MVDRGGHDRRGSQVCRYQLQRRLKVTYRLHEGAFEIGAKASQHSKVALAPLPFQEQLQIFIRMERRFRPPVLPLPFGADPEQRGQHHGGGPEFRITGHDGRHQFNVIRTSMIFCSTSKNRIGRVCESSVGKASISRSTSSDFCDAFHTNGIPPFTACMDALSEQFSCSFCVAAAKS